MSTDTDPRPTPGHSPVASSAWLSDAHVIQAMRTYGGSFVKALAEAAARADDENLRRVKQAWPEYWAHYAQMAKSDNVENQAREPQTLNAPAAP